MPGRVTRRDLLRMGFVSAAAATGASRLRADARAAAPGRLHLGLVTYNVAKDWDLDTLLRLVRVAGFEGVELRTTHAHGVEPNLTPAQRTTVRSKCADAGLTQVSLGSVCEFQSPDAAVVRRNVEECRQWVLLAKDIGAKGVKVRPNGLPKDVPEEKTLAQIGGALAECGAFAREHGVEIWMEVHGEGTKLPVNSRRIMDACAHPSVGLTWNSNDTDVSTLPGVVAERGSVREALELLRPFVRCCHITDLWGGYPYAELFALLRETGYQGFTLAEYAQPVPAVAGAAWLERYRQRWEELQPGGKP